MTVHLPSVQAQDASVVRVAASPYQQQADAFYARDMGFFKQVGLNVDVQLINSSGAISAAVAGGSLQIGAANPLPVLAAHERGLDFVIVAPGALYDAKQWPANLVVAPGSTKRTGKDFAGATIGVTTLQGLDPLGAMAWIDKTGGDWHKVKFIEMSHSAEADAVADGRLDAALIAQPADFIKAGKVRALAHSYDAIGNHFFASLWFARRDWADQNPDVVRRFALAITRASDWAQHNPAQAAVLLRADMQIPFDPALEAHARTIEPSMLQPVADGAVKFGLLDHPMDVRDVIWSAPH